MGEDVLAKGDSYTLSKIPCGDYDVKLADEDRDECTVDGVNLCGDNSSSVITNKMLLEGEAESTSGTRCPTV